jgi:hypothetical protein
MIKVELYRAHIGLTHCYNCQNFGLVWANCKQPPWCLWCCGGHLHRECPEKTNTESVPSCCSCALVEGETPHPASYWGCSHVKGEEQNKLPKDLLGGCPRHHSSPTRLHCVRTCNTPTTGAADIWERLASPCAAASATTGNSETMSVSTGTQFN